MAGSLASYNQIFKFCGLASTKFNTYYETEYRFPDFFTEKERSLVFINQFVATDKRNTAEILQIAYWKKSLNELSNLKDVNTVKKYNLDTQKQNSELVDLYFPLVLSDEYPGFVESLGTPEKIYDGILGNSGRTIWIFCDDKPSFCIKIDTMQLEKRRFFLERILYESSIEHTLKVAELLKNEKNVFTEHEGLCVEFKYNYKNEGKKKYRCLIRNLDYSRCEIQNEDFLIPMNALGSVDFWRNAELLKSIGINKSASEFFLDEIARCMADMLRNALDNTFVHFEVHMQNLSLHIRDGKGVKIIYHDLLDSQFDPFMHFLNQLQGPFSEEKLKSVGQSVLATTNNLQKTMSLNPQGQLVARSESWFECATVVSFYRRYLRNLGEYGRIFNILAGDEYWLGKKFESAVLKYMNLPQDNLNDILNQADRDFLKDDLFWSMNRYFEKKQNKLVEDFAKHFLEVHSKNCSTVSSEYLEKILSSYMAVKTLNFPFHRSMIDYKKIGPIYDVWDKKILFFNYDGRPVLMFILTWELFDYQ